MVTSALTTVRESCITGSAAASVYGAGYTPVRMPFLKVADPALQQLIKVESLQPSVRAAMLEVELLRALRMQADTDHVALQLVDAKTPLVKIGRLDDEVFNHQLQLVEAYAALRTERSAEVLTQVVPQSAHWSGITTLSPDRHRYSWELLGAGLRFTMLMVMQLKFEFDTLRPWRRSAIVQPMILTPGYTAYPSGHATEATFVAEFMPLLVGDPTHPQADGAFAGREDGMARQLNRLAHRIAENRIVAGLHFPVDSIAGMALGAMLARYMVWLTQGTLDGFSESALWVGAHAFPEPGVDGVAAAEPVWDRFVHPPPPKNDGQEDEAQQQESGQAHIAPPTEPLPDKVPDMPVLRAMWTLARREWMGA